MRRVIMKMVFGQRGSDSVNWGSWEVLSSCIKSGREGAREEEDPAEKVYIFVSSPHITIILIDEIHLINTITIYQLLIHTPTNLDPDFMFQQASLFL